MSIVHPRMEALVRIKAREDVLKCAVVEEAVVVVALTEVVVEEVIGCLFDVTAMSNVTREVMIVVADEVRSMLNVLHAPIGPLRTPKLLHLHMHLLPHLYSQKRKPVVLAMSLQPLELFRRRRLVKLNPRFKKLISSMSSS